MAKDLVGIFNLALSAAGTQSRVSLPTENSREANICNQWYEPVRDQILCAAFWASCAGIANPALVSERDFTIAWAAGAPKPHYRFMYAMPADFLYPRYMDSFQPFELGDNSGQPVIFTNEDTPTFFYTKKQTNPGAWSSDLYMTIVNGLAAHIAMSLHGKVSRAQQALGLANQSIIQARVNFANENQVEYDSMPDWLLARGVSINSVYNRFIYQYGPLFSLGSTF